MTESKNIEYEIVSKNFGNHEIEFIQQEDEIWITARSLGEGLEYVNPRKAVMKLFYRNQDELDEFSRVVTLGIGSTQQKIRLFNEAGIYLLIMFSKQPKAKGFRRWVANTVKQIRKKGYYIEKLDGMDHFDMNLKQLDIMKDIIIAQKEQNKKMHLLESKIDNVDTEVKQFEQRYEEEKPIRTETVKIITDSVQKCVENSGFHHYFFYKKIWDQFKIRSTKGTTEPIGRKIVEFIQTNPIFNRFLEMED